MDYIITQVELARAISSLVVCPPVRKRRANSEDLKGSKIATADASGYPMGDAPFSISLSIDPFSDLPEFDLNATLFDLDVTQLNDFMRHYGKFDLQKGTFSAAMEAVAEKGQLKRLCQVRLQKPRCSLTRKG